MSDAENPETESEEVTRCICGSFDLKIDDDYEDTGLFVQCDKCLVWQHGFCVGLLNDSQMPETYFCEICRPDLHRLIQKPRKPLRSKFLGVGNVPSPPQVPAATLVSDETQEDGDISSRKRRSTMNSRDAAYDRQLEAALLLSAQQDGGSVDIPAPSVGGRSGRGATRQSPTTSKRGRTPSPSPTREDSKQKKRKKVAPVKKEESLQEELPTSRRRGKKKGANSTTHNDAVGAIVQADVNDDAVSLHTSSQSSRPKTANHKSGPMPLSQAESRPGSRAASRESTPIPSNNSRKRGGARPSRKTAATSRSNNVTTAMPSTPSGRMTAMSELRKRVSAILEFVGRAQEEMATEMTEWSQFLPEDVFALADNKQLREDSTWGYGYGPKGSVALMEHLTSSLLGWESLYG